MYNTGFIGLTDSLGTSDLTLTPCMQCQTFLTLINFY